MTLPETQILTTPKLSVSPLVVCGAIMMSVVATYILWVIWTDRRFKQDALNITHAQAQEKMRYTEWDSTVSPHLNGGTPTVVTDHVPAQTVEATNGEESV